MNRKQSRSALSVTQVPHLSRREDMNVYQYEPLAQNAIRLLSFEHGEDGIVACVISHFDVDTAPPYIALSYAWGDQPAKRSILCNGTSFPVTQHLHDGLTSIRDAKLCKHLWVDAICINQLDDHEKAIQVQLMRCVYERTEQCVVWLGMPRPEADATLAIKNISRLNDAIKKNSGPIPDVDETFETLDLPKMDSPIWKSVAALSSLSWFGRLWVIQEATLASNILFVYGTMLIAWADMMVLFCGLAESNINFERRYLDKSPGPRAYTARGTIPFICGLKALLASGDPLCQIPVQLACASRYFTVSKPVDRVYGLLGMLTSEQRSKVTVNYSAAAQEEYWNVFAEYGKLCLQYDRRMTIFYAVDWNADSSPLPSWCPDLNRRTGSEPFEVPIYSAGISEKLDANMEESDITFRGNILDVPGLIVDRVEDTSECSLQLEINNLPHSATKLLIWLLSCWKLVSALYPGFDITDPPEEYCRALIADCLRSLDDVHKVPKELYLEFLRKVGWSAMESSKRRPWVSLYPPGPVDHYWHQLWKACAGRKVFITANGRFGIGPISTSKNDVVSIFYNTNPCYMLREKVATSELGWTLLGPSYVHGLMHGEAFESATLNSTKETIFSIY